MSSLYQFSQEVKQALRLKRPIVALESAVITHGLPHPTNLELALEMENTIRDQQSVPATIALLDGKIHIGLSEDELEIIANAANPMKISRRDFGIALSTQKIGGTTVAATLFAAHHVGIKVFATGGIGGVHRGGHYDISADLFELSKTPVVVVSSGAKSILDLPATLELLETLGVPIIGYQTKEFPAFFSRSSGLPVSVSCQSAREIAEIAQLHWDAGIQSAILVANPLPEKDSLPLDLIEAVIQDALQEAEIQGITGYKVTPYLLDRVNKLSGGTSMQSNLSLLKNNALLAAQISCSLIKPIGGVMI